MQVCFWLDFSIQVCDVCLDFVTLGAVGNGPAVVMLVGFWAVYVVLWKALGFPVTNNALWVLFVQAVISETLFIKWFSKE